MRKVICDEGNFQVADKNPLSVNVVGATGLKMPFDGAFVCSSMTLTPDLDAAGLGDFLYFPYRHTAVKRDDNSGFDFVLPNLKTADNKSFRTNKNYICFIEKDSILIEYVGSDIHTGSETPNAEGVIENPILGKHKFGANVINSCYARVFIYEFDDNVLAEKLKQLGPIQIRQGTNLTQELAKQLSIHANEVTLPGTFQMHAFDLSGRATDCASSLKNIGVERLISRPNLPDNTLLVQFIDLHGNTVRIDDFPFTNIIANQVFTAYSTMENGTQVQHPLYTCALPVENKLKFKKQPFAGNDDQAYLHNDVRMAIWPGRDDKFKTLGETDVVFDIYKDINKDYLKHRFIRFCIFHPSQLFQTAVGGGISPYPEVATPGFTIPNYRFNESRMNYFSDRNKVEIFNSPNDFFIDLEKTASSLVATDKLYQINWKANAHVHVKGSAAARGLTWKMINVGIAENTVQPLEEDIASLGNDMVTLPVYNVPAADEYFFSTSGNDQTGNGSAQTPFASIEKLNTLLADGTIKAQDTIYFKRGDNFSGTAAATEIPGVTFKAYGSVADANPTVAGKTFEEAPSFLKIPQTRASRANRNNVYQVVLNSVATPEIPAKKLHTGFVRPLNLPSIPFTRSISPDPVMSIVNAYFKLPTRDVKKHAVNIPLDLPSGTGGLLPFPKDFFSLGLDESGILPKAKIIRRKTFAEIQTALNQQGNELLHLLVFNANAGTHHFFALKNTIGIDQENQTLEEVGLAEVGFPGDTFPAMFHAEDIAYAAIVNAGPNLDSTFTQLLITAFRPLAYSHEAHNSGHIPLHDGEVGSIFRKAISNGADVKAIFWEQSIAALSASDPSYLRGESNNVKMKNIINNTINDKRGYAVIDRATRQQGSFHQKSTIIVRTGRAKMSDVAVSDPLISVVAYIGGVDIADGRWDDRYHHEHDPDRPSNMPWYDVHLKVTGDAAYDILMNFKHRMDAIVRFAKDADPNAIELDDCSPRFLGEVKGFINELDVHIPKANENPGIARAGVETMVQINRTIPPFSCHVDPIASGFAGDDSLVLGNEGELGILASYHKILNNARKFVLINDQYFMNSELAALLHKRLTDEVNPLDFAIILLPRDLGESAYVDPVLYKARSKAMHILIYGHQGNDDFSNLGLNGAIPGGSDLTQPTCGKYKPKSASEENKGIAHKVVFLSPINKGSEKTQNIYVHSKHMIVDDVWMTIGSANMGARSMTYDWEINANIVDLTLHKGGTMAVRNQRIEILARMVGIPPAYSAVFQDPYASFQLLKAIEKNGNKNIYPAQATVKKLPIDFLPFEPGSFVANLNIDSAALTWMVCNILDPDGRNQTGDRIGYFVQMFGIGKHPVDGGLNLIIDFEDASAASIRQLLTVDPNLRLRLTATVTTFDDPTHPITSDPFVIDQYALDLVQEDDPVDPGNGKPVPEPLPPVIRLRGAANNNVYLAVSAMNSIVVKAELVDGDATLGFSGTIDMQPNNGGGIDLEENEYPPNLGGATIDRTIVVSQETA